MTAYAPANDEHQNAMLRGRITLWQRLKGYRTSVDAMLLGWFASTVSQRARTEPIRIVDLGAGSGLVSIVLARHWRDARILSVEKQPQMVARCAENQRINAVGDRCDLLQVDVIERASLPHRQADLVVSNPPFHQQIGRHLPTDLERLTAHYETTATAHDFSLAAERLVTESGSTAWVYPWATRTRLTEALIDAQLGDITVIPVAHRAGHTPITRALVSARRSTTASVVELAPIALHPSDSDDSRYTPEIEAFLRTL